MTRRPLLIAAFLTAFLGTAAGAADYRATCNYFTGIAFNDRHTQDRATFREQLADDCAAALSQRDRAAPGTVRWVLADVYLARLEAYRWTMIGMASDRFRAARTRPATEANGIARPVSRTGAYLIAREMGLVANQTRWRAWHQAMAEGRVVIVE